MKTLALAVRFSLALCCFAPAAWPSTHVWTGKASPRFSDAANWIGGSPAGDASAELVFPAGPLTLAVTNDINGLAPVALRFPSAGYAISGFSMTLPAGASITSGPAGSNTISTDLIMTGNVVIATPGDSFSLTQPRLVID